MTQTIEANGQEFEFDDNATPEQIGSALDEYFGAQKPPSSPPPQSPTGREQINEAILSTGPGRVASEFAAAVNRGAVNLLDFFTTDQINNIMQIAGSEKRIPTFGDIAEPATKGNFMEDGLAKRAVRAGGEFVAPAAATGQVIRAAATALPQAANLTTGQRVIQAAASPASKEIPSAVAAGVGSELGGEAGGEIGEALGDRETGEKAGRLIGGIGMPVAGVLAKDVSKRLVTTSAKKLLSQAAPTTEGLKEAARNVYRELDNAGVTVSPGGTAGLSKQLQALAKKEGFNAKIHPRVAAALDEFSSIGGKPQTLSEIQVLRKVTKAAANSADPDERRLGAALVDKIDDFFESAPLSGAKSSSVSAKYRDARQLWRRAKASEIIEDAFAKAERQASGFENGIRTQFRSILNNKNKSRSFTKKELDAMELAVKGTTLRNLARAIGKLGFTDGQTTHILASAAGVAGGSVVGGTTGAVAVPVIGQLSKQLARKMTRNEAMGANLLARAGTDGIKVVRAYLKAVPAKERSVSDLTELLLRPATSLKGLDGYSSSIKGDSKNLISDAVFLTTAIKSQQEETR